MHTGVDDFSQLGTIKNWNFNPRTEFFPDKCGELYGSMGEFYPSHLTREKSVSVFTPDMCRTLNFDYEKDIDVHGVKAYKYVGGPKLVDNGTMYPENTCYCAGECMPSGVLNISACRYGSPVYMSFPHYLHADPFYREQIVGMKPVKEKHEFYVGLEPVSFGIPSHFSEISYPFFPQTTGAPVELAARFQVNVLIRPDPDLRIFKEIKETFMPILWFEQYVRMDESTAMTFRFVLAIPLIGRIFGVILTLIGLFVLLVIPFFNSYRKARLEKLNNKQTSNSRGEDVRKEASPLLDRFPSIQNAVSEP